MKNLLLAFVLCFPILSFSQNNTFYESHEVDSVAIPRGGYGYFTTFINANLQIPYMAKVAKVNGFVSLSGVVDEQGKISQIELIKGIRPDCDKEAIRVFGLFNAWKAALKGGKEVGQKVSFRIPFKSTETIYFSKGIQTEFLDKNFMPSKEPSAYNGYVQKIPIDTISGNPVGMIVFYKKEDIYTAFKQKKENIPNYIPQYPDNLKDSTLKMYRVSYTNANESIVGDLMTYFADGILYQKQYFDKGTPSFPSTTYYKNGMVKEINIYTDIEKKTYQKTSWHTNGQISEIIEYKEVPLTLVDKNNMAPMSTRKIENLISQWNELGSQNVKNGFGEVVTKFYDDSENFELITEKGKFLNFQKDSLWIGRLDDESVAYREIYNKGVLQKGISYSAEGDSASYENESEVNAQFKGGQKGYIDYLIHNLKYPAAAQRNNAQGKSFVQFVVCTDGSLCNFQVLKSAGHPSLDAEAIRVVQNSSGKWNSAVKRGRKVRAKFTLPINFLLSN